MSSQVGNRGLYMGFIPFAPVMSIPDECNIETNIFGHLLMRYIDHKAHCVHSTRCCNATITSIISAMPAYKQTQLGTIGQNWATNKSGISQRSTHITKKRK